MNPPTLKNPLGVHTLHLMGEKRKRHYKNHLYRKFTKAKPPTFDGEVKSGQEGESWLLGMGNYFQAQDYSGNMKARVAIFNLNGRESIWWEHLRKVKKINERNISSKSTSLIGTMMIILNSSISWNWDN